ncbi:fatty acid desaturase family protein [Streptomyces sp. NPDC048282]|uniref:fatty acid desaturase family protein n=1 Tax=Streptomyces sp. NPDC048282 TaxID=3365528 RepID=UPI00371BC808
MSHPDLRKEIRHVRKTVDGKIFAGKLALLVLIYSIGVALVVIGNWLVMPLGIILCGLMYVHAVELQHEALHGIGFRSWRANVFSGVLLGIPMLTSFAAYHASHMRHHRDLGTPENREFFDYGDQYGTASGSRAVRFMRWIYRFSIVAHYIQFFIVLGKLATGRQLPGEKPATTRLIRRDYAIITSTILVGSVMSIFTGSMLIVWVWLVPLLVIAGPVHAFVELPEHYGCKTDTTDVFQNTRSIRSTKLMYWFTNGNNYHVEHHFMPSLPIAQLGELHRAIKGRHSYYQRTYWDFFKQLFKGQGWTPKADSTNLPASNTDLFSSVKDN